jgi:hypothetical protein
MQMTTLIFPGLSLVYFSLSFNMVLEIENMKMNIHPSMLIGEVQKTFNSMFPYLRLEFYKSPMDIKSGKKISETKKVGDVQLAISDSSLEVLPGMTVRQLENSLRDLFTLTVQVFRKSGTAWLQTTITDNWTLQHQNEHGHEISEGRSLPKADSFD